MHTAGQPCHAANVILIGPAHEGAYAANVLERGLFELMLKV